MASLDRRLNPLYAIKECSSCGALYTSDYCCSKGGLEDKILVPKTPDSSQRPPQDCVKCGNPVEDLLNTYTSSDDDTNVVNAPQEPFVMESFVNDALVSLVGKVLILAIILHRKLRLSLIRNHATIKPMMSSHKLCQVLIRHAIREMEVHSLICPPKVLIISNPGPCNNQTIDELLQTLPRFDPTCYSERENSLPYVSKPNFVDDSPNVFNPPPQPLMYSYEFCGNDAYYGYDCPP
ncbi:hypothetical protein Tco_0539822 [Tanacetum coccineum]